MSLVLIIEDEPATAAPVKEALENEGIQADIADLAAALQAWRCFGKRRTTWFFWI